MMLRALVLTVSLIAGLPSFAAACDWPFIPSPQLYRQAAAVFVGRVVQSPWEDKAGAIVLTGQQQIVFEVQKTFKGSIPRAIVMTRMTDCTYPFLRGQTYLVHAEMINGRLETEQALRPLLVANASEELKYVEGAMIGRPPAVVGLGGISDTFPNPVTLVLEDENGKIERTVSAGGREIMLPAGEYTAWIELDGRIISDRKTFRLQQSEVTSPVFRPRR